MENSNKSFDINASIDIDYLILIAEQFIQNGNFIEAINIYFGILYQVPNNAPATNGAGWILLNIFKDIEKAEKYFQLGLDIDPHYAPIYLNYAILLNQKEDFDALNILLTTALKINGIDKAQIFREIGMMKEKRLEFDEAINAYKSAISHSLDLEHTYTLKDAIERCTLKKELLL